MNKSQNISSVQSRKWIVDSLINKIKVKAYKDITITEIVEGAMLSRKTFYRNFESKDDVLMAYFDGLTLELDSEIEKLDDITVLKVLRIILHIIYGKREIFSALYNNNLINKLMDYWNEKLPIIHNKYLDKLEDFPDTSSISLEYLLAFNVGGTFNIIAKWISDGFLIKPDALADIISEFAQAPINKCKN